VRYAATYVYVAPGEAVRRYVKTLGRRHEFATVEQVAKELAGAAFVGMRFLQSS